MPTTKFSILLFFLLLTTITAAPTGAKMTAACHCFKQRNYDPEAKFAADDYILTTSFNSLTANLFNIPKKQIIMLKMKGGIQQNDLLIALKLSHDFDIDYQQLLDLHNKDYSWQKILSESQKLSAIKNNQLLAMIKADSPLNDVGQEVANSMIVDFYDVPEKKVKELRILGFNEKEMALFFLLVRNKQVKSEELIKQIKDEGQSWSEIAHKLGITPTMAGKLIANYKR